MRRILVSISVALMLIGWSGGVSLAQQHGEFTAVTIRPIADGTWLMDINESDGTLATWTLELGPGCENMREGPAGLLVDGIGARWLVLPDNTPGVCPITGGDVIDQN
jgi:hypothetical protein